MSTEKMSYGRGRGSWGRGLQSGDSRQEEEVLEPSALLHVSDLPEHTLESDLHRIFSKFGNIKEICMLPHKSQAFVEFENIDSSKSMVERSKTDMVQIHNKKIKINFSTSQHIVHRGESLSGTGSNKVLLFTVYNAHYPINVDVLNQICSPHGRVVRIVIFRKYHLQAMVEFGSVEDATKAKFNLNGADIYSGCCTLKVEFAQPAVLTVTKNDNETWDYENQQQQNANSSDSLLGRPEPVGGPLKDHQINSDPYSNGGSAMPAGQGPSLQGAGPPGAYASQTGGRAYPAGPPSYPPLGYGNDMYQANTGPSSNTPVLMVYGLSMDIFNCQRLFNMLCLYGNVVRIKFLRSMEGSAMVQMGDPQSVDRAVQNLAYSRIFGNKLQLCPSKQAMLVEVANPYTLQDNTSSFQDFSGSRNNRFLTPEMAMKNKIFPPHRTLYFWNCPPHYTDEQVREAFTKNGCQPPDKVMTFPNAKSAEKTTSGLVQWERDTDAAEALVLSNNSELSTPTHQYPFAMRLSFAAKAIGERDSYGAVRDRSPFKDENRSDWQAANRFRGF